MLAETAQSEGDFCAERAQVESHIASSADAGTSGAMVDTSAEQIMVSVTVN